MAFQVYQDHRQEVIYQRSTDFVRLQEFKEYAHQISKLNTFPRYSLILDLSAMVFTTLTKRWIDGVATRVRQQSPACQRAVVINEALHDDLFQDFVERATGDLISTRLFDDLDDACFWLMIEKDLMLQRAREVDFSRHDWVKVEHS